MIPYYYATRHSFAIAFVVLLAGCGSAPKVEPPAILSAPVSINEAILEPCKLPAAPSVANEYDVATYVSALLEAFVSCSNKHQSVTTVLRSSLNQPNSAVSHDKLNP